MAEAVSTAFDNLYSSAMGKAVRLRPKIGGRPIGRNAFPFTYDEPAAETRVMRSSGNLQKPVINRVEIQSLKDLERKTLLTELAKNEKREADTFAMNLEVAAKQREEGIVRHMARLYEEAVLTQNARNEVMRKRLTSTVTEKLDTVDNMAENRALERRQKMKQNFELAKKKVFEKKRLVESAIAWENCFHDIYKQVTKVVADCPGKKRLNETIGPLLPSFKTSVQFAESLALKSKDGDLVDEDLKYADAVLRNFKKILTIVSAESEKIKQSLIGAKKKAEQEELLKIELEKKAEQELCSRFTDEESLKTYTDLHNILFKVRQDLEPLVSDKKMDQYRFQLQKAATVPVNAISSDSPQHMMDKYRKLFGLLSGARIDGCSVSTSDHPLGVLFVKELLSRLFVNQAEKAVSSKPDAAYPLASILVNLCVDFPDFRQLVKAQFFEKCSYLVPAFLPRSDGQTDEDYYRSLGYQVRSGKIEDHDMFLKRMEGIMRLYASTMITQPRKPNQQSPVGMAEAWRWSAAFLNLDPRPDISPILLVSFLEVVGHEMFRLYGKQFKKTLAYICKDYLPLLEQATPKNRRGPLTRFKTFLEQAVKTGNIPRPSELLPPNFW